MTNETQSLSAQIRSGKIPASLRPTLDDPKLKEVFAALSRFTESSPVADALKANKAALAALAEIDSRASSLKQIVDSAQRAISMPAARHKHAMKKDTVTTNGLLDYLCDQIISDQALLVPQGGFEPAFEGYEPVDGQAATFEAMEEAVSLMAGIRAVSIAELRAKARALRAADVNLASGDLICLSKPWQDLAESMITDAMAIL